MKVDIKTLSDRECDLLLNVLHKDGAYGARGRKGVRNYCIALLMLDAGLRVGEVKKLRVTDLMIMDSPVLNINVSSFVAKCDIERIVPVSLRLSRAIELMKKSWWSHSELDPGSAAFYHLWPKFPITRRQIERIVKDAGRAALGRDIHPHMLRHTFGNKLRKVTDLPTVQKLMGHKNLSSTQIYMHPDMDDMKNAIDNMNNGGRENAK